MKRLGFILLVLLSLTGINKAKASHVMGAEITWTCVGQDSFLIKLVVYRDCNGITLGTSPINLKCATSGASVTSLSIAVGTPVDITPVCKTSCSRCQSLSCSYPWGVHKYTMQGIVNLSGAGSCCSISISWDQCCRNAAITTMTGAGSDDLYIDAKLNRCLSPCDNSPTFFNNPIQILCVGQQFTFNHGVQDIDVNSTGGLADSLTYEWTPPLKAAGSPCTYLGQYAYDKPIYFWGFPNDALPFPRGFHLDPITGDIQFQPMKAEVTVMVIQVNEFRNGVKIGEIRRDLQILVINCTINKPPIVTTPNNVRSMNVGSGTCVSFTFSTNDPNTGDTVSVSWNNAIPGATWTNTNGMSKHSTGTLTWTPTYADAGSIPHTFTVKATDNACPIPASFIQQYQFIVHPGVWVYPVTYSSISCGPDTLVLSATGAISGEIYKWYTQPCGGTELFKDTAKTNGDTCYYKVFLNKTDTFYVSIDSAGVEGLRVNVIGIILPIPRNPQKMAKTVMDFDSNVYEIVHIGKQLWMKENLKVTHYQNGFLIPNIKTNSKWGSLLSGARSYANNDSVTNAGIYGALYNYYAITDSRSLCPVGWRIPNDDEWTELTNFLGGGLIAGGKIKETGISHWSIPNTGATNESDFTAMPGGFRSPFGGATWNLRNQGLFWTSTAFDNKSSYYRQLSYNDVTVLRGDTSKKAYGYSVRCIKDEINPAIQIQSDTICAKQPDTLTIFYSQPGIRYQLYKNSILFGNPQVGNGDSLKFPLNNLSASAQFLIYATDTTNSCSIWLDTTIFIQVNCCIADMGGMVGSQPSTNGLVAYYPFNGNANDVSGNGNNGIVNGATLTTDRFGNANKAYNFDGVIDKITLPSGLLSGLLTGTFSCWIKIPILPDSGESYVIFDKTKSFVWHDFQVAILDDGKISVFMDENYSSSNRLLRSNSSIVANQTYHLLINWQGNLLKIYINGNLDTTLTFSFLYIPVSNNTTTFGCDDYGNHRFKGILDDIRIYNRTLTNSEISGLYKEGKKLLVEIDKNTICKNESTDIFILNAQPGIEYSLHNASDSTQIGTAKYGKSDTLVFPVGILLNTTRFLINAKDSNLNCSVYLDTILTIHVTSNPVTAFSMVDSSSCLKGNKFQFNNNSSITFPDTFINLWNFGDNSNSPDFSPSHTYSKTGTFSVKLLTTSNTGCKDSLSKTVVIYPQSVPAFSMKDSSQCLNGNLFSFNNTTSGAKIYFWNFGDLTSDTNMQPAHQYTKADTFVVSLIAATQFGCKDTVSKSLIVLPSPQSDFLINDSIQCLLVNSFSFTNLSNGAKNYTWDFGDGKTDTASNPIYSYASAGSYSVKLKTQNTIGCVDSIIRKIEVGPLAIAAFTVNSKQQFLSGNNFIFSSSATSPKTNMNFYWDFGDGDTSTSPDPAHSYSAIDSYTVVMIATSDFGCADTFTDTVFVLKNPVKLASFTAQNACVGDEVIFNNTSKVIPPDSFLNFLWDFGDGTTIVRKNPKHIYSSAGTYFVNLVALTASGVKDTLIDTIEIFADPVVNITASPDTIVIPAKPVTLTATGLYDHLLWFDNSTANSVILTSEGTYWVIASYINGCKSADTIYLTKGEIKEPEIVNLITPNGDGINDMLVIKNFDLIKPCKLSIYNRWGDELFSSSDYQNNWDGTFKGKKLPEGTYYYILETKDGKVYKGAMNILK